MATVQLGRSSDDPHSVISDLHVASGRDPVSAKYSALDDFHAESCLACSVAHCRGADLVCASDTFDPT